MNTVLGSLRFVGKWTLQIIHYLYLSRVAFIGLLVFAGLPLAATRLLRTLVIGAYDVQSFGAAVFVTLAFWAAAGSIFLAARIVREQAKRRFTLPIGPFAPTIAKLWLAFVAFAFFFNIATVLRVSDQNAFIAVSAGVVVGLAVAAFAFWVVSWLETILGQGRPHRMVVAFMTVLQLRRQPGYFKAPAFNELEAGHASAISYVAMLGVLYLILIRLEIPALVTVMMVLAIAVLCLGALAFFLDRYRVPLLAAIMAYCAVMALWWQNDHYYRVWPRTPEAAQQKIFPRDVLVAAMGADKKGSIVVVASAGGGIQATAWTTATLQRIGEHLPGVDFAKSVRLVSGVSGGSVGGLFYAMGVGSPDNNRFVKADRAAQSSGLGRAMRGLLRDDLYRALAPFAILNGHTRPLSIYADRGHELEMAWVDNAERQFASASGLGQATLSAWGRDALELKRPALIFNSTLVETGERFALSTVPIERKPIVGSCEFAQRYKAEIAMTTAARLSATFPLVSPTARPAPSRDATSAGWSLPGPEFADLFPRGGNYLHAVDGGYYENSGIVGALEWLDDAFTKMAEHGDLLPEKVLFIELNAFPLTKELDETKPAAPDEPAIDQGKRSQGTLYDLTSPLSAIVNVRNSGQKAFATRVLELFRARWARLAPNQETNRTVDVRHVRFYYDFDATLKDRPVKRTDFDWFFVGPDPHHQPLSWHLRECEKKDISERLNRIGDSDEFKEIEQFFKP